MATRPPRSIIYDWLRKNGHDFQAATTEADEIVKLLENAGHIQRPRADYIEPVISEVSSGG